MNLLANRRRRAASGFTLVEVLISLTICCMVLGAAMGLFLFGLRTMYKDTVRIQTNAALRYFTSQIAKETTDSSEFYLFADYTKLDGSVDIVATDGASDMVTATDDANGSMLASGDCIVLVTRTSIDTGSLVRRIRIYYRVATTANVNNEAPLRYYRSPDWGTAGSSSSLETLLNAINLNSNSSYAGTGASNRLLAAKTKGRRIGSTANYYPVFCSEGPVATATNENFSINVEFISGNAGINMLSSSSFNYTVSPRR
jgi:prepilin-type N-terminal cleavage/methylation domain-containing protein